MAIIHTLVLQYFYIRNLSCNNHVPLIVFALILSCKTLHWLLLYRHVVLYNGITRRPIFIMFVIIYQTFYQFAIAAIHPSVCTLYTTFLQIMCANAESEIPRVALLQSEAAQLRTCELDGQWTNSSQQPRPTECAARSFDCSSAKLAETLEFTTICSYVVNSANSPETAIVIFAAAQQLNLSAAEGELKISCRPLLAVGWFCVLPVTTQCRGQFCLLDVNAVLRRSNETYGKPFLAADNLHAYAEPNACLRHHVQRAAFDIQTRNVIQGAVGLQIPKN